MKITLTNRLLFWGKINIINFGNENETKTERYFSILDSIIDNPDDAKFKKILDQLSEAVKISSNQENINSLVLQLEEHAININKNNKSKISSETTPPDQGAKYAQKNYSNQSAFSKSSFYKSATEKENQTERNFSILDTIIDNPDDPKFKDILDQLSETVKTSSNQENINSLVLQLEEHAINLNKCRYNFTV